MSRDSNDQLEASDHVDVELMVSVGESGNDATLLDRGATQHAVRPSSNGPSSQSTDGQISRRPNRRWESDDGSDLEALLVPKAQPRHVLASGAASTFGRPNGDNHCNHVGGASGGPKHWPEAIVASGLCAFARAK